MRQMNQQDVFLNQARKEKIPVTIYLTNGFQFKGVVRGFDSFTVILDSEERQNLVYKHAISTIIPTRAIHLSLLGEEKGSAEEQAASSTTPPSEDLGEKE